MLLLLIVGCASSNKSGGPLTCADVWVDPDDRAICQAKERASEVNRARTDDRTPSNLSLGSSH
jgi:hypothetical protein